MSTDTQPNALLAQEQRKNSPPKRPRGRPWPKGTSGNPGGRRKGTVSLKAAVIRVLTKKDADIIARNLIEQGKAGNIGAIKLLLNHLPDNDSSDDPFASVLRNF